MTIDRDFPAAIVEIDHVEPVPRRVRAVVGGQVVLDTTRALYVWEWSYYPRFYIPLADVAPGVLVDEDHPQKLKRGTARRHGLKVGDIERPAAAAVYGGDAVAALVDHVRFEWDSVDAWYEEDEHIFVHARSPYTRVDALRSSRHVRVALDGVTLAETSSPVLLFETGLPTRYYFDRTAVDFSRLEHSDTITECPYKGRTSDYWSVRVGGAVHPDLAWSYDFTTPALAAIAGLVAFYNEKVDIVLDGHELPRPTTHFS